MESVVHEPFGDILHLDACTLLPLADVEDAFVRDSSVATLVKNRKIGAKDVRQYSSRSRIATFVASEQSIRLPSSQ